MKSYWTIGQWTEAIFYGIVGGIILEIIIRYF
jgi:hypothetical protein